MTAPAFEEVPMPPTLPQSLLNTIGEYGMARTDRVSELEIQHRWELLIVGIKDYARAYGDQRANAALEEAAKACHKTEDRLRYEQAKAAARICAKEIQALNPGPTTARECLWTPDADGYWKTACGQAHTFTTDGPTENKHRFCCYCGGRISMKENGQ